MDESVPKVSSSQRSLSQSDPKTNCWMSSAVARSVPYNALCAMCSGELCPGASGDKDSHGSLGLPCKPCLITHSSHRLCCSDDRGHSVPEVTGNAQQDWVARCSYQGPSCFSGLTSRQLVLLRPSSQPEPCQPPVLHVLPRSWSCRFQAQDKTKSKAP